MGALIVIVDDETVSRKILRARLEAAGHEVQEAKDGQEGVDLFTADPPDVALVDLIMPVKDGTETIKEIRELHPSAKIIAMSAGAYDYPAVERVPGANRTFSKPLEMDQVLEAIEALTSSE